MPKGRGDTMTLERSRVRETASRPRSGAASLRPSGKVCAGAATSEGEQFHFFVMLTEHMGAGFAVIATVELFQVGE